MISHGTLLARRFRELLSFGVVGAIGFACDAGIFFLLTHVVGTAVLPARAMAFLPATIVTWLLNRTLVFSDAGKRGRKRNEYLRYILIQTIGIGINFMTFYGALVLGWGEQSANLVPLVLGSLAAMCSNYLGAKFFVFAS